MKVKRDEEATKEKFEVSRGCWFMRIKERSCLHYMKTMQSEAASIDVEATVSYPDLPNIINEGGYTKPQIFNRQTASQWKNMPSRTFIAREEKSMTKASKDRLTLLLGDHATADFKQKPVVT